MKVIHHPPPPVSRSIRAEEMFKIGLLAMAQEVRMCATGASDSLDMDTQHEYVEYMEVRLRLWKASLPAHIGYDLAVRALVLNAIREWSDRAR